MVRAAAREEDDDDDAEDVEECDRELRERALEEDGDGIPVEFEELMFSL